MSRYGKPGVSDDLQRHRCIRQRLPSGTRYRWEFERHRQQIAIDVPGPLTLNDNDLMVEVAVDGIGIGYVPEIYASDEILWAAALSLCSMPGLRPTPL